MKKKIASFVLSAAMLFIGGCGEFNFELSEGEGFGGNTMGKYTVIDPDVKTETRAEKNNGENSPPPREYDGKAVYDEEYENSTFRDENVENYVRYDLPEESSEENYAGTVPDTDDIFETETENTESTYSDYDVTADGNGNSSDDSGETVVITESISDSNNTESNTVKYEIYTRNADVVRNVGSIVNNMTSEEKAAQLILARCPSEGAADMMRKYNFGGYTLYARDFENHDPDSAAEFISSIKNSAEITPFIAVDEEGGNINRVSKFSAFRPSPFDSVKNIYAAEGIDGIDYNSKEKARLLTSVGVNMNLAPVADIAESGDYIYERTAGTDAETAGKIMRKIIDVSGNYGLMSCLKHFPGYGGNVDTHTGISRDSRSLESFRNTDFIPFKAGIASSYEPAVLVNHNIVECMDSTLPASLSPNVHRVLREELGFEGVIITDDLGMDGIKAYTGSISPYVMGIMAGNDLLCVSEPVTAYNDITAAVNNGTLPMSVIDEHVKRIVQMKMDFGLC